MTALPRPDPAVGVFETLLVRDHRVQALELSSRAAAASSRAAVRRARSRTTSRERVRTIAAELSPPHRVRIDAVPRTHGDSDRDRHDALALVDAPAAPVTLKPVLVPGGIGQYKWRDRRLLDGFDDGHSIPLILDAGDEVLEAGRMNFWLVEGRRVVTPRADGRLLGGVTRTLLLDLATMLELDASEETISLTRARSADSIFVTSSIRHAAGAVLQERGCPAPENPTIEAILTALAGVGWS